MPGNRTEENHREQDVSMTLDQLANRFFDKSSRCIVKPSWKMCHMRESSLLGRRPRTNYPITSPWLTHLLALADYDAAHVALQYILSMYHFCLAFDRAVECL
jgi:hypothetical protein